MRSAISPRLATRIFLNMGALFAYSMTNNGCPYSTASPFSPRMRVIVPDLSASISLRIFMASMMQMVSDLIRLFDDEQRLPVFDGLAVFAENAGDRARLVGLDLVEDFHGLDDADGL